MKERVGSLAGAWKGADELAFSRFPSYRGAKELPPGFYLHLGSLGRNFF